MIEAIQNTMVVQVWLTLLLSIMRCPPNKKKKHRILKENLRKFRLLKLTFQQVVFPWPFFCQGSKDQKLDLWLNRVSIHGGNWCKHADPICHGISTDIVHAGWCRVPLLFAATRPCLPLITCNWIRMIASSQRLWAQKRPSPQTVWQDPQLQTNEEQQTNASIHGLFSWKTQNTSYLIIIWFNMPF